MSDGAIVSQETSVNQVVPPKRKSRWNPEKDREPMKRYIAQYRIDQPKAIAAGFESVGKWRKAGCPEPKAA